ncbi:MAG: hypothetical protein WC774_04745 [Candidatus Gracilibacteria bacterium]
MNLSSYDIPLSGLWFRGTLIERAHTMKPDEIIDVEPTPFSLIEKVSTANRQVLEGEYLPADKSMDRSFKKWREEGSKTIN